MAVPFRQAVDLNQNELRNAVVQNLGGAPSNPKVGQIYFNTASPPSTRRSRSYRWLCADCRPGH